MERAKRKTIRLQGYDYNSAGYYFLTFCTKDKEKLLSEIVGTDVLGGPTVQLSQYGEIAEHYLQAMSGFYPNIELDAYVIMPNHIHLLLKVSESTSGPSGRPVPTESPISKFVGTFKRFCNREIGRNIWQYRSHDHVIRDEADYLKIRNYIETNPIRWQDDCFYQ